MFEITIIMAVLTILIILLFKFASKINKKHNKIEEQHNEHDEIEEIIDETEEDDNIFTVNEITQQRLKYMESGEIKTKKVMNIEETKIFYSMVKILNDYSVNPQVSFRAFLKGEEDTDSWKTFRDFYCDFLITHKRGNKMNEPIAVIEYHGGGHFGDSEEKKYKVENNDYIREKLFNKIGLKYFIIKDYDIKMNSGLIDEEKLNGYLNDINKVLSN